MANGLSVRQAETALRNAQEAQKRALREARSISEDAANGRRPDNAETEQAYKRAMADFDRLSDDVKNARSDLDEARRGEDTAATLSNSLTRARVFEGSETMTVSPEARYGRPLGTRSFSELAGTSNTASEAGEYIRALIRDDVQTRATMVEGTNSAGGYLVPINFASPLLDLARAKTQVVRAGAQVIPLETAETRIPRHDTDPVFTMRNEAAAVTETSTTIGNVTLTPRMGSALVRASIELVEDSSIDFGDYISNVLAEAAAVTIDQKALYGSGVAPDVRGVKNTAGVTITNLGANGAALANHDALVDLLARVKAKGYPVSAVVYNPRTEASIAKFREGAGTGQYLAPPAYLTNTLWLPTTQVPTNLVVGTSGATTTDVFAGDWSKVLIGVRHELSIQVLREAFASTGEYGFIAHMRFDVQVTRPAALEVLSGVTN